MIRIFASRRAAFVFAGALVAALGGAAADAATQSRKGTVVVKATINISPNVAKGATVRSSAAVSLSSYSPEKLLSQGQTATAVKTFVRDGDVVKVTLEVPYLFVFDDVDFSDLKLQVTVGFAGPAGSTSSRLPIPMPKNGATAPVSVELSL